MYANTAQGFISHSHASDISSTTATTTTTTTTNHIYRRDYHSTTSVITSVSKASVTFSTIPNVPTPYELTRYEYGRLLSGKVHITSGNQKIEFFSGVANMPLQIKQQVN